MKVTILPYKKASKSAGEIARALNIKYLRLEGSKYKSKEGRFVINWGSSKRPPWDKVLGGSRVINGFSAVKAASNKLTALTLLRDGGVNVPFFTTELDKVVSIMEEDPQRRFMGRTLLTGSGGEGCYFISGRAGDNEVSPEAAHNRNARVYKLFTDYIPKTAEYRVHVMNGKVFDVTQKKSRKSVEAVGGDDMFAMNPTNYKIRSYNNGWVFCREGIEYPPEILDVAIRAVQALSLDFGAVDIIWNRNKGIFVLEVNTAPGLEGTTLENYIEQFKGVEEWT